MRWLLARPASRERGRIALAWAPPADDARARRGRGDAVEGMGAEIGVEVDADEAPAETARGDASRARADEGGEHDVAGPAERRHGAAAGHGGEPVGERLRARG